MTTTPFEDDPDATGYLGLPLYEADEQDLVDAALADAASKIPDWVPREGNTEVVLLEALALITAENVFGLNRLGQVVIEGILKFFRLERDAGAPTEGTVEFTLSDSLGHTIPAGTTVRVAVETTGETVDLDTVEPLEILSGSTTGTVGVRATEVGLAGNGVVAGTVVEVIDAVAYVDSAQLASALAGGREIESDETYFDRGSNLLSRLVSTLVLPLHFTAAALENANVGRAVTIDMWNPASGNDPGEDPGHVTVVVADHDGAALSTDDKATVTTALENAALAALTIHVIDPAYAAIDVTSSIVINDPDPATVIAAVEAALTAYLSPTNYPWYGTVYVNEVISLVDQIPGVVRVVSMALDGGTNPGTGDQQLSGGAIGALPTPGALTITEA